jgi:hypothetical protein
MNFVRVSETVPVEAICNIPEGVCIVISDDTPVAYIEKLFYRRAHDPKPPEYYKDLLADFEDLEHVTIEVNQCNGEPCLAPANQEAL